MIMFISSLSLSLYRLLLFLIMVFLFSLSIQPFVLLLLFYLSQALNLIFLFILINISVSFISILIKLDYQTVDLIEKPVGSSLFITQPAASIQSVEIGPDFTCDEVPSLLFNSDYSKLAVVFECNQVVQLFSVSLSSSTPSITSLSELTGITSFVWSYSPAKYATVEEGHLYITVFILFLYSFYRI